MPKALDDRVKKLMARGMPQAKAYAIGTSALQKEGKMAKAKPEKPRTKK
jgi:uncharacterized protein YoaH (UPF0181 family)